MVENCSTCKFRYVSKGCTNYDLYCKDCMYNYPDAKKNNYIHDRKMNCSFVCVYCRREVDFKSMRLCSERCKELHNNRITLGETLKARFEQFKKETIALFPCTECGNSMEWEEGYDNEKYLHCKICKRTTPTFF